MCCWQAVTSDLSAVMHNVLRWGVRLLGCPPLHDGFALFMAIVPLVLLFSCTP